MSSSQSAQVSNQEEKILLAIQAYKKDQISSIHKASVLFAVPFSTLQDWLSDRTTCENSQFKNQKLISIEESVLVQWIIFMNERDQSSWVNTVQETVDFLLFNHENSINPSTVNKNWVKQFINCHFELKTQFVQLYNYKQALCEDLKIIQSWFDLVWNTIQKYEIVVKNIYNFNKTEFQMRIAEIIKIITRSEKALYSKLVQFENTKWIIIVKKVNASDWMLLLMIIFKRKLYQTSWFKNELLYNWRIEINKNE